MMKKLLRLLRIAPLALVFAGVASAQTTGTIIGVVTDASTGKPVAGAVVIATSPNLQGEQTAVTDGNGNYRLTLLPPGDYRIAVQLEGYKPSERSDIRVSTDKTLRAPLSVVPEAVQMEEQVIRTGSAPVVNIGSAETGAVISQEFISSVPVGRGFEAVAIVTPTATVDGLGGIAFAGAQSAENQYIVDGLNTTDPTFGTRAGTTNNSGPPSLRNNFTQEIDVKTGNYGAEYGRATGGILNVSLKSGSNDFHGSVFGTLTPSFLVEPDSSVAGAAGEAIAYKQAPSKGQYAADFGFEIGGPVLKDKLWFYAGFSPIVTHNTYERWLRSNTIDTDPSAAVDTCPAGYTGTGDVHGTGGQCVNDQGEYLQSEISGTRRQIDTGRTTYQWVGKLTYLLNENNSFTVSAWGAPSSVTGLNGGFFAGGTLYNARSNELLDSDNGQTAAMVRYGGKFLDKKLITEVQAGWYAYYTTPKNRTDNGVDQFATPSLEWVTAAENVAGFEAEAEAACPDAATCPVYGYTTGGRGGRFERTNNRFAAKASAAYLFEGGGQHNIKGGIDLERVDYAINGRYTGGAYYLYTGGLFSAYRGFGVITPMNGTDPIPTNAGTPGIERNTVNGWTPVGTETGTPTNQFAVSRSIQKNTSETDSFAYYVQDAWTPSFLPNVTVNAGIRLETQAMRNLDFEDATGFDIKDNWSPRIGAIWDFTGTGRGKVAASWGRFYYAMPLDMGARAFGAEVSLRYNLNAANCGFNAAADRPGDFDPKRIDFPVGGAANGFSDTTTCRLLTRGGANNDIRLTGGTLTPADDGLKGQFVDQWNASAEYEVMSDLSIGLDYQGRRQGYVIEDMSSNDGGTYYIGNPGRDRDIYLPDGTFAGNSSGVTTRDPTTGRLVSIKFPEPTRSYDGLTFRATKQFSKNWLGQASYTYSVLRGNYSGPYFPEYGQLDPGITAEYDLASLMANKAGLLPGDQTHSVKLYGSYTWNLGPRFNVSASGAYRGISGTPVSVLGAHPDYGSGQAFVLPKGMGGRSPFTSTVDIGAALGYVIKVPYELNFRVDVFNVLNSDTVQAYDDNYTYDTVAPITGIDCKGRNSAGKSNPVAALQADCPGLAYMKTVEGNPVSVNSNWGKPQSTTAAYQAPLSARMSLSLSF